MPQADFYVLPTADPQERLYFLCKLVDKIYRLGHKILIVTDNEEILSRIDQLLYEFRIESFIPHVRINDPLADRTPVLLGVIGETLPLADALINLSNKIPDNPECYARSILIVTQAPESLKVSRESYSAYRNLGIEVKSHKLSSI